jgi:hypothetical protein
MGKAPERAAPPPSGVEEWRSRGISRPAPAAPADQPVLRAPVEAPRGRPGKSVARDDEWRSRSVAPAREARAPEAIWRSRSDDSPAKRVIDGAVPGRRWQEDAPRVRESAPADWRQRVERPAPAPREYRAPQPQREYRPEYRPEAREYRAPQPQREYRPEYRPEAREYRAPQPQREYRPEYRPEPREYRAPQPQREYRPAPPQREYRPAPPPRVERAPQYSAPPAPPSSSYKGRGNGRGNKG